MRSELCGLCLASYLALGRFEFMAASTNHMTDPHVAAILASHVRHPSRLAGLKWYGRSGSRSLMNGAVSRKLS